MAQAELPRFAFLEPFKEMLSAERYIAIVAANLGLRAGRNGSAFSIDAQIHRSLASALANRLQLDERVGKGQQGRRPGE